ncbi:MAG: hypothetical protein JXJ04_13745, partial [Spirochaetales bacterium]|nr:hypothetical protein [Spirochaetales bacterium]
ASPLTDAIPCRPPPRAWSGTELIHSINLIANVSHQQSADEGGLMLMGKIFSHKGTKTLGIHKEMTNLEVVKVA